MALSSEAAKCNLCPRMSQSSAVLSLSNGNIKAPVLFVGEAPGRMGADRSMIPFHGDKAGHNFEDLLAQVGINRYSIFVTNAALCNPRDSKGNNATPSQTELRNCSTFLRKQIELVNPKLVVSIGGSSLAALSNIDEHSLSLREHVRTIHPWFGRKLIPAYHPGQRAMIHRSFANQLSDYQFIAEQIGRINKSKRKSPARPIDNDIASLASEIISSARENTSLFALHKLFYLAECEAIKRTGARLTSAYVIRQKDGPYFVDLHPYRIKKAIPGVRVRIDNDVITLKADDTDLFENTTHPDNTLSSISREIISDIIAKYGDLDSASLKRMVYLTKPMKKILRREKAEKVNLYNQPIEFG